jgi:hypothetical protein
MDYEKFWKALLNYGTLEKSELKTWMRHMEQVWRIHGTFDSHSSNQTARKEE